MKKVFLISLFALCASVAAFSQQTEVNQYGQKVNSYPVDATVIEDIKKTIADCGLEGVENINYLQAIKRVIGMYDKPLANE